MNWFRKKKQEDKQDIVECPMPMADEEVEFKPFHQTYRIITFALSIGMMFPNLKTQWRRFIGIMAILTSIAPVAIMIFIDMYEYWLRRDYIEIIRHTTIVGPFLGGFSKMFLMLLTCKSSVKIIQEIDRDYALYNLADTEYKNFIRPRVRNSLVYSERWWAVCVIGTVMTFPLMAAVSTLYNFLFKSEPQKFMIHDINVPNAHPEARFESPYFEFMFAYLFYCACLYVLNFLGYDGFFGLAINHACLKIELYCKSLEDAMKEGENSRIQGRMVGVIEEQNRTFRFIDLIQESFNIWLGIIFIATMIQLCNLLYHISEGYGFDLKYMIFIIGVTIHIYLPCHYATKLQHMCASSATAMYCSGWEDVYEQRVRHMLVFMIARAQITTEITALNMLTFNMDLFVSIMQTSYSMYTLLSS